MVRTTRGRGGGTMVSYEPQAPAYDGSSGLADRREELLDCLVFRQVVEPGACWTAAGRTLLAGERSLLEAALDAVEQAGDPASHRQADSRLHLAIAGVTGSPMIITAVTGVQSRLHDMLQAIPVLEVNIQHSNAQHTAIVTAILAGQPARARRAMEQHCEDTAALLRGLLF
jgi:GntR family transcriptional repressor for pyruvate dehydrogenase complex